jgi:primosomal protein N' (replication factor Y)
MSVPLMAQVALPVPVARTFSYHLPPALAGSCLPGCRVKVPFGRKKLIGVVVGLLPLEERSRDLRDVLEVLDPLPRLNGELLEFTSWMADYYFAPWGLVLQAALPASLRTRTLRKLEVTGTGTEALEDPFSPLSPKERRTLDLLARRGPLPSERLRALLPEAGASLLRRMESRRWIRVLEKEGPVPGSPRLEEWARAGASFPLPGARGLRGGRERLVAALTARGGVARTSELLRSSGISRASLRTLARVGWLSLEKRPVERESPAASPGPASHPPSLNSHQRIAVEALKTSLEEGSFRCHLLEGVTGSGKTEVYMAAASLALERGQGVLYMVPEIGLTPLLAERLAARFPGQVAVLHSGLGEGDRRERWERIRRGEVSLVLGTRSSLFAPHPRIGLVIVDEEQDASYYQSESPRYHARDAALVRARRLQATAVLGSATPSLEAIASVRRGKFRLLSLPERVEKRPLPEVRLIDMREEFVRTGLQSLLSRELLEAVREIRASGSQGLILLNRRGFSTFVLCRSCGHRLECSRCSIALTYHRSENRLRCHYCNSAKSLPAACPRCRSPHLHAGGAGTERLEEAIRIADPELRIARMDRDTARGKGHELLLRRFEQGEIDLMLGTQMLAKGHDFPRVTLVGVLSADALLALPDFRAAERTYQLLAQAAGRAGRGDRPGRVLIQAFATEHPAIQAAASHDPVPFYDRELHLRKVMAYPPWVALTQVRVQDRNALRGESAARRVAERLRAASGGRYAVLGPAPAPLVKLKGEYRYQILVKGKSRSAMARGIREVLDSMEASRDLPAICVVETDPRSLL